MITENVIEEIKNRLINLYNPLAIYIFGSYAWGNTDDESDLDLLIVIDEPILDRHKILVDGHKALVDLYISKDILVYSKDEFDQFSKEKSRLCYKVKHKGKLIYGEA